MDRKLLFISKYPDIVQEFLVAMDGKEIAIDVASNGIEAAAKLKKEEYQVVVTGIALDGYNGEQIITYLNKNRPNTVCIIYTTNISPSQLHFFINERSVFRVFLRPVDFQGEFFEALEEAFGCYDVRVADEQDKIRQQEEVEKKRQDTAMMRGKLARQKYTRPQAANYLKRLVELTINEYTDRLGVEEKEQKKALEWQAIDFCFKQEQLNVEELEQAEELNRQIKEKIANIE